MILYKLLAAGAIAVAIGLGGYAKGRHDVTVVLERERAVHKSEYDARVKENAEIQGEWKSKFEEKERAHKATYDEAASTVAGFARRLRLATSRSSCTASGPTAPSGLGEPASEVPDSVTEIERDADAAWAAAGQDAAALDYCVPAYNSVRDKLLKLGTVSGR